MNRFNDPNDPTKVLLATDAIGMGMNLNIKRFLILFSTIFSIFRVIFSQLKMSNGNAYPPYFIKQIAGRAGRFKSRYCTGEVKKMNKNE
jgi:ATP-dependent RNA helicase SUPV3L1/SUV3